jgi:dienelactone hydrolase
MLLAAAGVAQRGTRGEPLAPRTGVVQFECCADEAGLPRQFQLERHRFTFHQKPLVTSARNLRLALVTFPSPVVTPHPNNNTVHCEYFCPLGTGSTLSPALAQPGRGGKIKRPGVVVLHILGGDFDLARLFCRALASRGVAALFMKMPYYGERRQPDSPARMVSLDAAETVRGMTQAVLDARQAAAWLAAQDEVDPRQLGIMGISLGGITSALAAGVEPRFTSVLLILAGGDMGEVAWTSAELAPLRKRWTETGGTKESLFAAFAPVDPVRYARPVEGRRILMLNARHDEVVPRECTESLWRAFGRPPIIWWEAGHYSAARYLFDGVARAVEFFQPDGGGPDSQSTAK